MPLALSLDAHVVCKHELGVVKLEATQQWVTVQGRPLLVEQNPEGRSIHGCPMYGIAIKPCTHTLPVTEGYSHLVRIQGRRLCLATVTGLTDGTPPGAVHYIVRSPGQTLVSSAR
jgi:hypothetical protein